MSEHSRSEQACPVCSEHSLALDRPPEIDVMGVQQYSDMLGMGDLPNQGAMGIVCLSCGTHWRDKEAFDRGEADVESEVESDVDAPPDADFEAEAAGGDAFADVGFGDDGEA
jgi:hypothetical protein